MSKSAWFSEGMEHIWLPYAQMKTMPVPLSVVGAEGVRLKLADGRELVDGVSSWWSVCHGYNHPHLVKAMTNQVNILSHVMFGGLVHDQALTLASRLCAVTPGNLERVFFSDSGSVAVEVAMKMALQYWHNKRKSNKNKFICFRHGYHGDTIGAMAVSDCEPQPYKAFKSTLSMQYVVDLPRDEYGFAEFTELLSGIHGTVAGIIIEPLVQGAGGMIFHSPDILAEIARLAKAHDILFIADEIAVGFGRTGTMFACAEANVEPDILCLGKALTGGMIGMAATLATDEIFSAFLDNKADKAFMHGPTYMANPLACAAANASLDVFEQEPRMAQVERIESQLRSGLAPCRAYNHVVDVRIKGAIGVVQLEEARMDTIGLRQRFIEQGVWIRPFRDIVYLMPPLTIAESDLEILIAAVNTVIGEWASEAE